jgi:hypothetical protein
VTSAQSRADTLEQRLSSLDKNDPRRGAVEAELKFWRTKAVAADVRAIKRQRRMAA